jgi:hypothetical protein
VYCGGNAGNVDMTVIIFAVVCAFILGASIGWTLGINAEREGDVG